MILERLEPKNSEKVAVGVPERPFEVAKGVFFVSSIRLPSSPSTGISKKNVTLVKKSGPESNDLLNSSDLWSGIDAPSAAPEANTGS